MIYVPAPFCKQALLEAIEADIKLIVCITEGIPVMDMLEIKELVKSKGITLIGPNSPGIISSGLAKLGIMPISIHARGCVGIMSRSGTLTYEVIKQTSDYGLGQTSCIGIGGDPIVGSSFIDIIKRFEEDEETKAIVMLGEIGGNSEEEVSLYIKEHVTKPVIAYIAGVSAPKGQRMGHAGAITKGDQLSASEKKEFLKKNGIIVVDSIFDIGKSLSIILGNK
jgi:succinyl-CoA synthetase alpha subunit